MAFQNQFFSLKKRRAVSDDSKLATSHRVDEEMSDSRSERSDMAVKCAAVNKRSTRRQVCSSSLFQIPTPNSSVILYVDTIRVNRYEFCNYS